MLATYYRNNEDSFVDNLMLGVQLADVSTRCSSHPQGKSEARCEIDGNFIGVAPELAQRTLMRSGARAEVQACTNAVKVGASAAWADPAP